ncbi:MAG: F0F1 ATP synthase subunit B [Candidatus Dechloromonas phosphoritropha]|nr:F0F1 ATP synthase subunit B [Candidatus Dechloromonas phosphoritropha]MBP8787059.1 F0F1 ATP synthase subunit B [Azonexus sp.]MBP9226538.1 F0F1 ATP synthase subunit B [Azonexus sp.]
MNINATLIGQAIWFAVFIWITMKYVWPPLQKAMANRQAQIAEGLAAAERGKHEQDLAAKRSSDVLRQAKEKSAEIVVQAEKRAQQIVDEAKGHAKVEADKVVAGAKAEIDQEVERAKQQLRERVAELAVAGAEKILRKEVNASVHAGMLAALKQDL